MEFPPEVVVDLEARRRERELKAFAGVEKEYFDTWVKRDPLFAVRIGVRAHQTAMPDGTPERELDDHRVLKRLLGRLEAVNGALLPPARRIDRDLLVHVTRQRLFEGEELRLWESVPEAPGVVGYALFQVFAGDHVPLLERLRRVTERMEKMPRYVKESRAKLTRPVKAWVDGELETITRLPSYFDFLKQQGRINLPPREYDRMCRAIEGVQNEMEEYANWIIIDILPQCRKEHAIGRDLFARLLEARGLGAGPEELLAFGWRQFKWHEATLKRIAHKIKTAAPLDEIREMIRAARPGSFPEALNFVRETVKRARDIIVRAGFATMPDAEDLRVAETPVFLRHRIPFGACLAPPRFDPKPVGLYFVTPGEVDRDRLKEHNFAALANMTVHESYPGHHLQFTCANRHPSLARVFARAPETMEGWAHYCEEEMKRLGFDSALKSRFVQTEAMVWRAARVVLDVRLATGKTTLEEAAKFLSGATGMERLSAEAEVGRYTRTPGEPLSYLWGKEKIKELKAHCRKHLGRHFSERFFHDAVLYAGCLPLKLLRRELEWRMEEELKRPKDPPKPVEVKGGKGKPASAPGKAAPAGKAAAPGRGPAASAPSGKAAPAAKTPGPAAQPAAKASTASPKPPTRPPAPVRKPAARQKAPTPARPAASRPRRPTKARPRPPRAKRPPVRRAKAGGKRR